MVGHTVLVNTFSNHYKNKYGLPVGKIALDRGVVCPNRLKGGCIFCAPRSFRPYYQKSEDGLCEQIGRGKKFLKRKKFSSYFAYFQQETTTAACTDDIMADLRMIVEDPSCVGIILSTRPDCLENSLLDQLETLLKGAESGAKEIIIELGLQSAHDISLKWLNRNHSVRDFQEAIIRVKKRCGLQVGAHLIFGIPGEGYVEMEETVKFVCEAGVQHLKIHHLQIIKETPLDKLYCQHPFPLFTVTEYLDIVSRLLQYIPIDVVIHRLWSTSERAILRAPFWDLSNLEMWDKIRGTLSATGRRQGQFC